MKIEQMYETCDPSDVNTLSVLKPYAEGKYSAMICFSMSVAENAGIPLPVGAEIVHSSQELDVEDKQIFVRKDNIVFEGDGFVGRAVAFRDTGRFYEISGKSQKLLKKLAEDMIGLHFFEEDIKDDDVEMFFVTRSSHGGASIKSRRIACPGWAEVQQNYASNVRTAVDPLMSMTAETVNGKILLMHGEPGTGKTHIIRSLAKELKQWCDVYVILDPEAMFTDTTYMQDAMYSSGSYSENDKWKLFVLEDCGELIKEDSGGQALSKLLNASDGIMGQGLNVMFAITTNERFDDLHPAVTRPGRSMGSVSVGPFTKKEAELWLAERKCFAPVPVGGLSLAELYATLNDKQIEKQAVGSTKPKTKVGFHV